MSAPLTSMTVLVSDRPEIRSLSERAYYLIRHQIVSLQLPPGSSIDERLLMTDLGLGRTPIREALRRLATEDLVAVYPRRGMFVTAVDAGDLAGVTEVTVGGAVVAVVKDQTKFAAIAVPEVSFTPLAPPTTVAV